MLPNVGELAPGEPADVAFLDKYFPAIGPDQPDDMTEGHALPGATPSEQTERLTRWNRERKIVKDLQRAERLRDVIESHGVHPDTTG